MYPCLLLKVLAEYDLQLCACSKRDSCVPVPVRLARGYTPRLHLNVVAEPPGKSPGVLHTGEGDRSFSGILRTDEENRKN